MFNVDTLIAAIVLVIVMVVLTVTGILRFVTCVLKKLWKGEEVNRRSTECGRELVGKFRMTEDENKCELHVIVNIQLILEDGVSQKEAQTAMGAWQADIEDRWSRKFAIRRIGGTCACAEYQVLVNVVFDFSAAGAQHFVRVRNTGAAGGDLTPREFDTTMQPFKASHEFGHMLGFLDEYPEPNCPDRVVPDDQHDSIMGQGFNVKPRHYQPFADWISTCCKYEVAS